MIDEKKKKFLLNILGWFLIVLGLVRVFQLIFFGEPIHILWLCNHVIIFMGIAILFRSSFWLIAEFSFLFLGQVVWVFGVLIFVFFGIEIPGNSTYLLYDFSFLNLISLLVHFLTLPVGAFAIYLLGKKEKFAWSGGLIHALILVPFALYFGKYYNLNCIYEPCISFIPDFALYSLVLIPVYFALVVFPTNYFINYLLKKSEKGD